MQLVYELEAVLTTAGYRVARLHESLDPLHGHILFEDDTVLGFAAVLNSVAEIRSGWQAMQNAFLRSRASGLRRDQWKAWAAYSVFLTADPAEDHTTLIEIESDVAATRKIARGGILTAGDIRTALAPLLPLAPSAAVDSDVRAALEAKLSADERTLYQIVQDPAAGAERNALQWLTATPS
jgi:hypothetical protein